MKRFTWIFLLLNVTFSPFARAEDPIVDDDVFYTDEDDQLFNRGVFVGLESDDYLRVAKRERNKNWAVALGTTALGIAALVLVGSHNN